MKHECEFDKMVHMDTRDTFFQSDPFGRVTVGLFLSAEIFNLRYLDLGFDFGSGSSIGSCAPATLSCAKNVPFFAPDSGHLIVGMPSAMRSLLALGQNRDPVQHHVDQTHP